MYNTNAAAAANELLETVEKTTNRRQAAHRRRARENAADTADLDLLIDEMPEGGRVLFNMASRIDRRGGAIKL